MRSSRLRPMTAVLFLSLAQAAALPAFAAAAAAPARVKDAREQAPPALLGIWKVDAAASTPSAAAAAIQLRSFQYTAEGKIIVNFVNIAADGKQMIGHWSLQLDGSPGYEYRSDNGSTPIAEIRFAKVDDHTFNLTNSVGGVVEATAQYKLSEDGQTLTMTRSPKTGPQSKTVYKRWDGK